MLLATVNSGTLIIALPELGRSLHTSVLQLVWVILAYMIASTVLVLTRGSPVGPLRPQAGLRRRLRRLRARLARRRLRRRRDAADPVAHRAGRRRRRSCSPTPRRSSPTRSRASSSASRWGRTRWSPRSASCSARCSAACSSRSTGRGCSGSTCRSASLGAAWGALDPARARQARRACAASTSPARSTFVLGLTGLVLGISRGGLTGWGDPLVLGGLAAAVVLLPAFVLIEARIARADARPRHLPQPHVRRRDRRGVHQRPVALRADVRLRLLLPGRAGRRRDHGRHQARAAGARHARRLAAGRHVGRPPRLAHARRVGDGRQRARLGAHDDARRSTRRTGRA